MKHLAVVLSLLLASAAGASPPLGDLTIASSRVPDWYLPPDPPDTSGWTVTNVNAANCDGSSGTNDRTAIQAAIDAATPPAVIQLQGSVGSTCIYNIRSSAVLIDRSQIVIKGGGMAYTNLKLYPSTGKVSLTSSTADGTPTNWTAGYTRGTTTVTVASTTGIVAGDWILLQSAFPAELGVGNACNPGVNSAVHIAIEKVSSVNGGASQITFDHGLRDDYSNAATCQQTVAELHPISQSGIEGMTITATSPENAGWEFNSPTNITNVVESWVRDVKYVGGTSSTATTSGINRFIKLNTVARVLLDKIWLAEIHYWNYDEGAIDFNPKSYESAVINSIMEGTHVDTRIMGGVQGIIWAYNFSRCTPATGTGSCAERSVFFHGLANETLVEGNDLEVSTQHDNHWGSEAYRNTLYRNRVSTNPAGRKAGYNKDSNIVGISSFCEIGGNPLAPDMNLMLNVASRFRNDGNGVFDCVTSGVGNNYWIERNLVEGSLVLTPAADTHNVSNVTSATTTSGVGDWSTKTFPASLVYSSKPSWWLSAPWPAIGADVDVIGSGMHKLPAQCRYEDSVTGDCAPYSSARYTRVKRNP